MEQISSYVLDNKTTRFCLLLPKALLYTSVSLIHPTSTLDPYRFVIDYALGPGGSANNGSPGWGGGGTWSLFMGHHGPRELLSVKVGIEVQS
jgi:hypothetical protein